eukprot:COSAG02_NODE_2082_length_9895_cov_23.566558_8_plen_376_part_00
MLAADTLEMILRVFAQGFAKGKYAYLRSGWNILDGFLVLFAWGYMILKFLRPESTLINPSVLRIIRCLRPLRTAGFVNGVASGLRSWPFLLNLWLVLIFAMTIFGVLGVQMFGGALTYQCLSSPPEPSDRATGGPECSGDSSMACNECVARNSLDLCSSWGVECSCYDIPAPEVQGQEATELVLQLLAEQRAAWLELNRSAVSCPKQLGCPTGMCTHAPVKHYWGFDNIGTALLTCWITATGDMGVETMMPTLAASESSFKNMSWLFFVAQTVVLNLVVSNLFAAVIVHAFLEESTDNTDRAALEDKIRKERALFNRIDVDKSGEISVDELSTICDILDLKDTDFADWEIEEAKYENSVVLLALSTWCLPSRRLS